MVNLHNKIIIPFFKIALMIRFHTEIIYLKQLNLNTKKMGTIRIKLKTTTYIL